MGRKVKLAIRFLIAASVVQAAEDVRAAVTENFEIYGVHNTTQLDEVAAMGFTQVVLEDHSLANEADRRGLRSVLANWWGPETGWDVVRGTLDRALGLPGVVSVNLMDEPMHNGMERFPASYYLDLRNQILSYAPTVKLSLTEYGPQPSWPAEKREAFKSYLRAVDILRIDPYPIAGGRPLRAVYDWMTLARTMMNEIGHVVPLTVILQTWNSGEGEQIEMPSIPQLRVMAYLAVLGGATGLSFFDYNGQLWDRISGFREGFSELIQELHGLSEHYRGWDITSSMSADGVFTSVARSGSAVETVIVNTQTLTIDRL